MLDLSKDGFDIIEPKIMHYNADIVCITETWLTTSSMLELCKLDGYTLFSNVKNVKSGGGTATYVRDNIRCRVLSSNVASNLQYMCCGCWTTAK